MRKPPVVYTTAVAEIVLRELSAGRSLRELCQDDDMPTYGAVLIWVRSDRDGFAARYAAARKGGRRLLAGRPALYTADLAERILRELVCGGSLLAICEDDGMPAPRTVRNWVKTDHEGFAARYRRACELRNCAVSGRKTLYTEELVEILLQELSAGRTVEDVCNEPGMPKARTVRIWVVNDRDGFAERYRRAREIGCHAMADQCVQIADDSSKDRIVKSRKNGTSETALDHEHISRSRLRCDERRWLISKMLPKTFGDRLDLTARHDVGTTTLAALMKAIDGKSRGLPNKGTETE